MIRVIFADPDMDNLEPGTMTTAAFRHVRLVNGELQGCEFEPARGNDWTPIATFDEDMPGGGAWCPGGSTENVYHEAHFEAVGIDTPPA